MTDHRNRYGKESEDLAAHYLQSKGVHILQRNYRTPYGEIDIIGEDGPVLLFVEVKSRQSNSFGLPREAVTLKKQQTIISVAQSWLSKNQGWGRMVRFDVIEIYGNQQVVHLPGAFGVE